MYIYAFASFFLFIQRIHRYSFYSDPLSLSFSGITIFSSLPFSQTFLLLPFLSLHFFLLIKHFLLQFHSIPHKSLLILDFTITYPLCKNPFSRFQLPFHSIFTNLFIFFLFSLFFSLLFLFLLALFAPIKEKKKMEVEAERVSEPNDAVCAATNGLERGSVLGIDLEMVA